MSYLFDIKIQAIFEVNNLEINEHKPIKKIRTGCKKETPRTGW